MHVPGQQNSGHVNVIKIIDTKIPLFYFPINKKKPSGNDIWKTFFFKKQHVQRYVKCTFLGRELRNTMVKFSNGVPKISPCLHC